MSDPRTHKASNKNVIEAKVFASEFGTSASTVELGESAHPQRRIPNLVIDPIGTDPLQSDPLQWYAGEFIDSMEYFKREAAAIAKLSGWFDLEFLTTQTELSASPFKQLEKLRDPANRLLKKAMRIRRISPLPYANDLLTRLGDLIESVIEDGEQWEDNSVESLDEMIDFLESRNYRYPIVTVTPQMTFRAEWKGANAFHFALDFHPNGEVVYVLFRPDDEDPSFRQAHTGRFLWRSFEDVLKVSDIDRLCRDENERNAA